MTAPSSSPQKRKPNLDSVTTINDDGSRLFLHPADVSGRFTFFRRVFGALLLLIYVSLPWIYINGNPAVFLDVAERRFHLFGLTFLAKDLYLSFFVISGLGFTLFYVTALFGRLWCGWACPYTVFLEHVFRRIERWIEGDAPARRKLDAAPWTPQKIAKRVAKHAAFFLCATLIAHIFLSYFVSLKALYGFMHESPFNHLGAFGVVAFLSIVLYFCFSWFREQFCIILCPYGRIQSALTDEHTVVIGYDGKRGEPRGKASNPDAGDCIDCHRCVNVCPTGIDIRNGLQLECIGCAACIDACDDVMAKLKRPKGLIRYDSETALEGGKTRWLRPRVFLYTFFLAAGAVAMMFAVNSIHSTQATLTRMRGQPHYVTAEGVRNQYNLFLETKLNEETEFTVKVADAPKGLQVSG
ncbi:MAG: cytochrome c oxidase accessory protein CcoG, partial [Verrucomicrobiales bacterium]